MSLSNGSAPDLSILVFETFQGETVSDRHNGVCLNKSMSQIGTRSFLTYLSMYIVYRLWVFIDGISTILLFSSLIKILM